ncbi:LutC/YkgG family protein [Oerskovia merdavium]|uniref:LUD domain-containing protein n=1 Tax=Oerskovia merdavium TaxID=2762227 RepID=A0ABR8TV83_9CELL|nr:LUD domain-containing protein [Oerskovia merdavium]MBD7979690.1 LUD domain-containing protein [Oerskovia merdavium]
MSARDDILARVRAAVINDGAHLGDAVAEQAPVSRGYRTTGEHSPGSAEAIEILVDRLVDYRAIVHRAATTADLARTVGELLADARSVVVPPALPAAWTSALTAGTAVVHDSRDDRRTAAELDQVDAVLTASRLAVADTGTIVLDGADDQGRRAITLVPDLHVCVVRTEHVVHTLPEAVTILAAHPTRPQTWISGPSATSDIELSRVEGVHGPRTLHVILLG